MQAAIRAFLQALGERFDHDDLEATPERVARAWAEDLVSGYGVDPAGELTWTPVAPGGGPVLVRGMRFASVCVHHLLPFFGRAHVAYLPAGRQAGLSKLGRVVDAHARRLQTQERLTQQVLATLLEVLEPRAALVLIEAEHTCMSLRGVRKEGAAMVTLATGGGYETDAAARREIVELLRADVR